MTDAERLRNWKVTIKNLCVEGDGSEHLFLLLDRSADSLDRLAKIDAVLRDLKSSLYEWPDIDKDQLDDMVKCVGKFFDQNLLPEDTDEANRATKTD